MESNEGTLGREREGFEALGGALPGPVGMEEVLGLVLGLGFGFGLERS